jgi:plastocyanin
MKRHWLMPALSAASAFLTLACGSDSGGTSNNPPPAGDVLVQNDRFSPTTFSVTAGSTVTWAWDSDGRTHTVTSDDGSSFNSNQKSSGTFQHTFATAGTFAYHCEIHPSMVGTITVTSTAGDGGSGGGGSGGGDGGGGGGYGYMRTTP